MDISNYFMCLFGFVQVMITHIQGNIYILMLLLNFSLSYKPVLVLRIMLMHGGRIGKFLEFGIVIRCFFFSLRTLLLQWLKSSFSVLMNILLSRTVIVLCCALLQIYHRGRVNNSFSVLVRHYSCLKPNGHVLGDQQDFIDFRNLSSNFYINPQF